MTRQEAEKSLFTLLNYGDAVTEVIGHRSPDADTVTSAIAMAELLNLLGISAVPRIAGPVNRETAYILETFGVETPEILADAAGHQLWLVDHSDYDQAVQGAKQARIVGIVDHHGIGDVESTEMIYADCGAYVSTATAVYRIYVNCGLEISVNTARLLLAGIMSDSNNLNKVCTRLDRYAYRELQQLAQLSPEETEQLNRGRRRAKYDISGLTDAELFYGDNKVYVQDGVKYGISNVAVYSREDVEETADRMRDFIRKETERTDFDFLVCMIQESTHELQRICFAGKDPEKTDRLMQEAFGKDSREEGPDYIHYPGFSRKRDVVPRISEALKNLKFDNPSL